MVFIAGGMIHFFENKEEFMYVPEDQPNSTYKMVLEKEKKIKHQKC